MLKRACTKRDPDPNPLAVRAKVKPGKAKEWNELHTRGRK
jgi:hypothetical protein